MNHLLNICNIVGYALIVEADVKRFTDKETAQAEMERRQKIRTGRAKYNRGIGVTVESCYRNPWYGKEKR